MSDFIEDFYYGNIEPQECTTNLTANDNTIKLLLLGRIDGNTYNITSIIIFVPSRLN